MTVVGDGPSVLDSVLVWDEDAPCGGDDESYVHYAGPSSAFAAMTAGAGPTLHAYRAAAFVEEGLPVPAGTTGCYAFTTKGENGRTYECLFMWQVAKAGSVCPQTQELSAASRAGVKRAYLASAAALSLLL